MWVIPLKIIGSTTAYIEKNKAMMNDSNVWDTHYAKKSEEEKVQMFESLTKTRIGFDVWSSHLNWFNIIGGRL